MTSELPDLSESTHLEALEALIRERLEGAWIPVHVVPTVTSAEAFRAYLDEVDCLHSSTGGHQ